MVGAAVQWRRWAAMSSRGMAEALAKNSKGVCDAAGKLVPRAMSSFWFGDVGVVSGSVCDSVRDTVGSSLVFGSSAGLLSPSSMVEQLGIDTLRSFALLGEPIKLPNTDLDMNVATPCVSLGGMSRASFSALFATNSALLRSKDARDRARDAAVIDQRDMLEYLEDTHASMVVFIERQKDRIDELQAQLHQVHEQQQYQLQN